MRSYWTTKLFLWRYVHTHTHGHSCTHEVSTCVYMLLREYMCLYLVHAFVQLDLHKLFFVFHYYLIRLCLKCQSRLYWQYFCILNIKNTSMDSSDKINCPHRAQDQPIQTWLGMQGRFSIHWIGQYFHLDLLTTDKLKFSAWFEVNPSFGSKGISCWNFVGHICPPPPLIRFKY